MSASPDDLRPAYLTGDLPGTGGRVRAEPGDFRVEEIPLAPPAGEGEHLYLWIEKRGLTTIEAVRVLARRLGADERAAGYAGLKDARAVARQWLSFHLPGRGPGRAAEAGEEGLRVLEASRGRTRLRRGALRGNRFEIRIRGAGAGGAERARAVLAVLGARGVPNAFGDQRFGAHGHSAALGRALALGAWEEALAFLAGGARLAGAEADARAREAARRFDAGDFAGALALTPPGWEAERRVLGRLVRGTPPERALRALPARERGLLGAAFQAALFNGCLARRLARGDWDRLLAGDVIVSHATGRARRVGDPQKEAGALARFEASPAGPLLGERTLAARGEPGRIEAAVIESYVPDSEAAVRGLARMGLRGGRRPYRARIEAPEAGEEGEDVVLRFALPPGAYASEVLREVAKAAPPWTPPPVSAKKTPRRRGGGRALEGRK